MRAPLMPPSEISLSGRAELKMTELLHLAIDLLFAYAQRLPILRRGARFKIHLSRGMVGPRRNSKEDASKALLDIAVSMIRRISRRGRSFVNKVEIIYEDEYICC